MPVWEEISMCTQIIRGLRLPAHNLGLPFYGLRQSYHCTRSLLLPRDTGPKPVVRLRRSPLNSKLDRIAGSTEWHEEPDDSQGQFRFSTGRNEQKNHVPERSERRTGTKSRISSELQKLCFEDFSRENHRIHGNIREEKTFPSAGKGNQFDKRFEFVFGVAPCLLALSQGKRKINRLFVKHTERQQREAVQTVSALALERGIQIQRVNKKELDRMTRGGVHQGLCLQASPLTYLTDNLTAKLKTDRNNSPLWLVLDSIQDPMNLGAILRSAYFLGVDRVVSSLRNSCPLTPVVSKASSGVMEIMGVYGQNSLEDMVKVKAQEGWHIVGTVGFEAEDSAAPTLPCHEFRMTKPTLLLMGGEGVGLSPELRQTCDVLLTIPPRRDLHPAVESLNVSVATGILLHSLLSSRRCGQ
ncbi:rRNA methyltransferase 1, mitochondrial [Chanos chanos]|uniref:rRNA methyltransferase 1, mitochondrial n=1 Tax=Chanos chanos TaxID=29144 RepID=A0A6J2WX09_CHACN|nr:rRNA methyltransferase 1, mitochondrial [Chanos chanos]